MNGVRMDMNSEASPGIGRSTWRSRIDRSAAEETGIAGMKL